MNVECRLGDLCAVGNRSTFDFTNRLIRQFPVSMLRNYLTIALRNLRRQKGYTAINVLGLAVGMAACLLIGLYVEDELSYDDFHEAADRIVVVGLESDFFGSSQLTPYRLGTTLADDLPEVEAVARTAGAASARTVRDADGSFRSTQRVLVADSTFFEVFDFPFVRGNPATALDAPHQAVITESVARTYFGDADPMGRTLRIEDDDVTVTGVLHDVPSNSTLRFDVVVPLHSNPPSEGQLRSWGTLMFHTYVRLNQPVEGARFAEKVQRAVAPHVENFGFAFTALPLPELYLSDFYDTGGFSGQRRYVYLFGTVAVLILLIAAINYVNLVTAQSERRAREVGVRKAMGARRDQVARQFLGESVLLSLLALGGALVLTAIALPVFNGLFGKELTLGVGRHLQALGVLVGFVLAVSVGAGAYPSLVLSRFEPSRVLRSASASTTRSGGWLRKGLVVTQFAVSAGLILGTVVMYQQLRYVQHKNLGFDGEQVVTVGVGGASAERQAAIKQEVLGHPAVRQAAVADAVPGGFGTTFSVDAARVSPAEYTERETISVRPAKVDADYLETLGLTLLAGRNFSDERPGDRTRAYILNEAAVEALGWTVEEAVGKPFTFGRGEGAPLGEVIGVVKNFHIESLRAAVAPVVLQMEATRFASSGGVLAARLAPDGIRAAMDHIERVMAEAVPGEAFTYAFLDDTFDAMYRSEQQLARIFTVFAAVAILIACMGLFGLAAYAAQRRTKEIGIRKALGASVAGVVALLSREFAVLVAVALALGVPVAYWGVQRWLEDFAYRVEVGPATFVLTAAVALAIAGATVGVHAFRAARTDPAKALRYE